MTTPRSRREFLGLAAAASLSQAQSAPPDLILVNANVYTLDNSSPRAEALAVSSGRFTALGPSADIRSLRGPRTEVIDARRMTVVPGFIDCHNHAPGDILLYEVLVGNPYLVEFVTISSIIAKLSAKAAQTPPGMWVEGFFFDDTKVKDGRPLNVHDLDQVSKLHPVAVHHRGGHTSFYNSEAFRLAGVTDRTPNPRGGTFDRDSSGRLNGRVTDNACPIVDKAGRRPVFSPTERARRDRDALEFISRQFVRYGLTSVHHEGGDLSALQQVRDRGALLHRVSYEPYEPVLGQMIAAGVRSGFGDEWIRIGATAEFTIDGSFSERTMALSRPYPGVNPPYRGNVTVAQDELNAWVEHVHRAGIQVNCHANGDVAIGMFLTAVERAQKLAPRPDARPKITHCTLVNTSLLARMRAAGAVPAVFTSYTYYNSDKFHFYGEELMRHCMAYRDLLDAGIPAAAGSDFPPGPFDPRMAIQGMTTRTGWNGQTWGPNQKVSVAEAIRISTANGAFNSHEESIKGSIAPGKLADFVILSDDPHTLPPDRIKDIEIVRTVVGGRTVWKA